jgi:5-carboxymethyl-2-hydroxymuconate isomerase
MWVGKGKHVTVCDIWESGKTKHKNDFIKVHNVLTQGRENLPPKHLITRLHHVTTQSMQKLKNLCYMISTCLPYNLPTVTGVWQCRIL